jgi:hypothetical protein
MSQAKKIEYTYTTTCDRCGWKATVESASQAHAHGASVKNFMTMKIALKSDFTSVTPSPDEWDLCQACWEDLDAWLHGITEQPGADSEPST